MSLAVKRARAGSQGGIGRGRAVASGDPGLFGGILGAVKGGLSSLVSGGNPIAGAISGGTRGFRGPARNPSPMLSTPQLPAFVPGPGTGRVGRGVQALLPGGKTGFEGLEKAPSGYHWNKTGYFLRDGSYVAPGSKLVKNRRKNPLNVRALSRAISRVEGGKAWQGKLAGISTEKYTAAGKRKNKCA